MDLKPDMRCPDCTQTHEKEETVIIDANTKVVIYIFSCGAKIELKKVGANWTPTQLLPCRGFRYRGP